MSAKHKLHDNDNELLATNIDRMKQHKNIHNTTLVEIPSHSSVNRATQ